MKNLTQYILESKFTKFLNHKYPDDEVAIRAVYDLMNERQVEWENSIRNYQAAFRE